LPQVGTIPLDVREFTRSLANGESAQDYIEQMLVAADNDLSAFEHEPILEKLKLSPDGVTIDLFSGLQNERANLALAMNKRQAVVYHQPSGEYRMASRAHRTALIERWSPL